MPRGGARIGAGRKPKYRHDLEAIDGGAAPTTEARALAEAPEDIPSDQQQFWREYAPLAIERRTLTPATVPAFKLLCELRAEMVATKATIDKDGRTYIKVTIDGAGTEHEELRAHPLKADYAKLGKQVEGLLARFCLAAFGKPMAGAPPTKAGQQNSERRVKFFGVVGGQRGS